MTAVPVREDSSRANFYSDEGETPNGVGTDGALDKSWDVAVVICERWFLEGTWKGEKSRAVG